MRRLVKFSASDRASVGVETVVHHFATVGLTNPFTNEPVTWAGVLAANPDWDPAA